MAEYFYQQPTEDEVREFWSNTIRPKESVMELNFAEKAVTLGGVALGGQTTFVDEKAWEDVVLPAISSEWHDPGKDEIEHLLLYNNDKYMCQRKKIKYDFATQSTYWVTYNYTDGDVEDVKRIRDVINTVVIVQKEAKQYEILEKARELNLEQLDYYYDQKWFKKMAEIQKMLLYSDFRVLPDTPVKYDGEKTDWATWRQRLRDLLPDNPREEFADNFEMFKFIQTLKYPIDPRKYLAMYPNRDVEYLSTDDQFQKYDFEASVDFVSKTQLNLINYLETYDANFRPIDRKILDLARELKLDEVFDKFNFAKFIPTD